MSMGNHPVPHFLEDFLIFPCFCQFAEDFPAMCDDQGSKAQALESMVPCSPRSSYVRGVVSDLGDLGGDI